ncbi:MAG: hypothetical protein QXV85_10290 [Candidatus Bathyarchaeia archaeon]
MKARKALSRILVEILLVVIVLAALAGAYFVYSMYAGSASSQLACNVDSVYVLGGSPSESKIVVNLKNVGTSTVSSVNITATNPSIGKFTAQTGVNLQPGQSKSLTFNATAAITKGQTYVITLEIKDSQNNVRTIQLKATAT